MVFSPDTCGTCKQRPTRANLNSPVSIHCITTGEFLRGDKHSSGEITILLVVKLEGVARGFTIRESDRCVTPASDGSDHSNPCTFEETHFEPDHWQDRGRGRGQLPGQRAADWGGGGSRSGAGGTLSKQASSLVRAARISLKSLSLARLNPPSSPSHGLRCASPVVACLAI